MKELIEKFEKETGLEFYTASLDKGEDLYSYDFVNWLIKQLPIHGVVRPNLTDKHPIEGINQTMQTENKVSKEQLFCYSCQAWTEHNYRNKNNCVCTMCGNNKAK